MTEPRLYAAVERNPSVAFRLFWNLEGALNKLLPGSELHERYRDVGDVALAVAVGHDAHSNFDPFDPATSSRVSFINNNRSHRPEAWLPKDTDAEILGGEVPEDMGRFTAFALAKMNHLLTTNDVISFDPDRIAIEPGKVGIAGGIWVPDSLLGVSGLWEVHDHVVARVIAEEMKDPPDTLLQNSDKLAEKVEPVFWQVNKAHKGVPAAEVNRHDYMNLLLVADGMIARLNQLEEVA